MSKLMEFKVGQRVRDRWDRFNQGTITNISTGHDDQVEVQWDDGSFISSEMISDVLTYDPIAEGEKIAATQLKIDEATQSLEAAFQALKDAANLYDARSRSELFYDPMLNVKGFERAVEAAGWETSSLYC